MSTILAVVGALVVGLIALLLGTQKKTDQVLADNNKVKEDLKKADGQLAQNNTDLKKEEDTRNQLKEDIAKAGEKHEEDPSNIIDFFNNRK